MDATRVAELCKQARERVEGRWTVEEAVADAIHQALREDRESMQKASKVSHGR